MNSIRTRIHTHSGRSRWTWAALLSLAAIVLLVGCATPDEQDAATTGADGGTVAEQHSTETDRTAAAETADVDTAVAEPSTDAEEADTVADEISLDSIVAAHNKFGLLVHDALTEGSQAENVFISPLSISLALSMAYNGADGETAAAMADTLQLHGLDLAQVNASHRALLDTFAQSEADGVRLHIANAIWHAQSFTLGSPFVDGAARDYDALIRGLDFSDPASVGIINEWVEDQTAGLIEGLVEELDADLVTLLVNTVYFKGDWTTPFDPALTRDAPFHLASGGTRTVPFMYRDGQIDHFAGDGFQAVRLPYGEEERLGMYVFLPNASSDLAEFADRLADADWDEWAAAFTKKLGEVRLPKLDFGYKTELNDVLQALGMGVAFNPQQADFSAMLPEDDRARVTDNLYIGDVVHQSVLKVDEEGTEAAAATSVGMRMTSMPAYKFQFTADRPFFLAIRDDETGSLLFVGSIVDPD